MGVLIFIMAFIWQIADLAGTKNEVNTTFAVPNAFAVDAGSLRVIHNGKTLKRVAMDPGPNQYALSGLTVVVGLAPAGGANLWFRALIDPIGLPGTAAPESGRIAPNFQYFVEIRNTDGDLLELVHKDINALSWAYETLGGFADAEIGLRREFDAYGDIDLDYDVRIFMVRLELRTFGDRFPLKLPFKLGGASSGPELRWRGFVRAIRPIFDFRESVRLRCAGYVRQLEYVAVPQRTYQSMDVGAIARSIIDEYVVPATQIKRTAGLNMVLNQGITISATGLTFDTSAFEALRSLAEIGGNAEWGVKTGLNLVAPSDNEIYFLARDSTVKQTWLIGDRVQYFETERTTDEIIRRIHLRGMDDFTATITSALGVESGRAKERVVFLPFIRAAADATLWATAFFARWEVAQEKARLTLSAVDAWIEGHDNMPPLGRLRVQGGPVFVKSDSPPETLGGSTYKSYRIARIEYRPSPQALRIEIDLGEKRTTLDDYLRGIEYKLSEIRQAV